MTTNRELYFRDPATIELLNNGVSKVAEIGGDDRQIKTLRFELETFVCDGEYARGLERLLRSYLDGLGREEQKAVWRQLSFNVWHAVADHRPLGGINRLRREAYPISAAWRRQEPPKENA